MSAPVDGRRAGAAHALALAAGLLLYAMFWGLGETVHGLRVTFHPPLTNSSPGELQFWLGFALLLIPGTALIGVALAPWLGPGLARLERRVGALTPRERWAAALALSALYFAAARIGHQLFLRGFPFTDDEYAVRFGGQVLALGKLKVPAPEPASAFPAMYLFVRDGWITSMDWIGAQAAWALAELTGLGPALFALAAALGALAVAWLMHRRLGGVWGLVAFLLFCLSPMAAMLSLTTHTHVLSRTLIAITLLLYSRAESKRGPRDWFLVGAAAGIGFCVRPVETAALLSPLLAVAVWTQARAGAGGRRRALGLCVGGAIFLLLFALHNWAITGNPLLQARFAMAAEPAALVGSFWHRFGSNAGYSAFLLGIWFLGPLGWVAACGLTDRFTRLLGLGILCALAVGCFHDYPGIHPVGPIHYSEAVIPLIVLAIHGLERIRSRLAALSIGFALPASALVLVLTLGLGTFDAHQALALRRQALIQARVYEFVERTVAKAGATRAIVLAPTFARTWLATPLAAVGTWVFEWRRARPDLSDDILILHDQAGVETELRQRFPDRALFRLSTRLQPPYLWLEPVALVGPPPSP